MTDREHKRGILRPGLFVEVGDHLRCSLRIGRRDVLALDCRVVWIDARANAGVRFLDLTPLLRRRLADAVQRIAARQSWDGIAIDPVHAEDGTWAPADQLDGDEPS